MHHRPRASVDHPESINHAQHRVHVHHRVRLHSCKPTKQNVQQAVLEQGTDAWSQAREKPRGTCKIRLRLQLRFRALLMIVVVVVVVVVVVRQSKGHDTKGEVQVARVDDNGGVETVNGWLVCEPGGRQRQDYAVECCVMPNGEG